jgi:hypothetical protein
VAQLTDQVWWDSSADSGWSRPDFALVLEPQEAAPVAVSNDDLQRNAEAGLAALREAVGEESVLAELYSALFSGQRPAILSGLCRPLPPEGIAALLLPLPRSFADKISVAGWMLSQSVSAESFRRLWDVLVCSRPPAALCSSAPVVVTEQGREAAWAIFNGDPSRLPRRSRSASAGTPASRSQLPSAVERIVSFATDDSRRWLAPEEFGRPLRTAEVYGGYLVECVQAVEAEIQKPEGESGSGRREHLEVKADLLRAAALALAPATAWQVGTYKSCRVPALLYCPLLAEQDWDRLGGLGEAKLSEFVRQSLDCRPDLFGKEILSWLVRWGSRMKKMDWLAPLLERPRLQ